MRNLFALSFISASLFAATDAAIMEYFKSRIANEGVKISITKREKLPFDGFEMVKIMVDGDQGTQNMYVFTKGDLIFPDIIDLKSKASLAQKYQNEELLASLAKGLKSESPKNFVFVGADKNKETLVMFTDPECPYCIQKINSIEDGLKTYNFKIIFTPVHDVSSFEKSALIYQKTALVKTDAEKIAIIKKYFGKDAKVDEKVDEAQILNIQMLKEKYFNLGIEGVPFIVSEKDLAKFK